MSESEEFILGIDEDEEDEEEGGSDNEAQPVSQPSVVTTDVEMREIEVTTPPPVEVEVRKPPPVEVVTSSPPPPPDSDGEHTPKPEAAVPVPTTTSLEARDPPPHEAAPITAPVEQEVEEDPQPEAAIPTPTFNPPVEQKNDAPATEAEEESEAPPIIEQEDVTPQPETTPPLPAAIIPKVVEEDPQPEAVAPTPTVPEKKAKKSKKERSKKEKSRKKAAKHSTHSEHEREPPAVSSETVHEPDDKVPPATAPSITTPPLRATSHDEAGVVPSPIASYAPSFLTPNKEKLTIDIRSESMSPPPLPIAIVPIAAANSESPCPLSPIPTEPLLSDHSSPAVTPPPLVPDFEPAEATSPPESQDVCPQAEEEEPPPECATKVNKKAKKMRAKKVVTVKEAKVIKPQEENGAEEGEQEQPQPQPELQQPVSSEVNDVGKGGGEEQETAAKKESIDNEDIVEGEAREDVAEEDEDLKTEAMDEAGEGAGPGGSGSSATVVVVEGEESEELEVAMGDSTRAEVDMTRQGSEESVTQPGSESNLDNTTTLGGTANSDLHPVLKGHCEAVKESRDSLRNSIGRRSSSVKSGEERKREAAVENFVRCGAVALERGLLKLDTQIQESGVKRGLVMLENNTMKMMKSSRPALVTAMHAYTKTIRPDDGFLRDDEAEAFFCALVRAGIEVLLPVATKWITKLYEAHDSDATRLKDLIGTATIADVPTALRSRWECCEDELAQTWFAFCAGSGKEGTPFSSIEDALLGETSINLAVITQVVLHRPRWSNPKDLFAPAATCSPLFSAIPKSWVSHEPHYLVGKVRLTFMRPRDGGIIYELSSLRLIRMGGEAVSPDDMKTIESTGGGEGEVDPTNLMKKGTSWSTGEGEGVVSVIVTLATEEIIVGYIFQMAPEGSPIGHDPAEWTVEGATDNGEWTPLHATKSTIILPKSRGTWCRPMIFGDPAAFTSWFGEHLLTKDNIGSRLISTQRHLADRTYIILVFLSRWMLAQHTAAYLDALVHFYKRNSRKKKFEIILVSSDPTTEEFMKLYKALPWAAMVHSEKERKQYLENLCGFDGAPKAVLFHAVERSMEDLSPVLLTESVLSWARRDREAKQFPWVVENDDGGGTRDEDGGAGVVEAKKESKKKKWLPWLGVGYLVILGVLGVWPLVLGVVTYGTGVCKESDHKDDSVCVEAEEGGSTTCNSNHLNSWFIINGTITTSLLLLSLRIAYHTWTSGLSNWDTTLRTHPWYICFCLIIFIFLSIWYIFGNIEVWSATDSLCGTIAIQGRYYFFTTYALYGLGLGYIFLRVACEPSKKTIRNLEHDIEMGRAGPSARQVKPKRAKKRLHMNPSVIPKQ